MAATEQDLHFLYQLMEEEISRYRLLIGELGEEAKYLRQNTPESLMKSVQAIEVQTAEILKLNESIHKTITKILSERGGMEREKTLSGLLSVLPSSEHQKIKLYQKNLKKMKGWVERINNRNKSFIQESLNCWKELFSMLTRSLIESPVYIKNGEKQLSAHFPYSLNQKV